MPIATSETAPKRTTGAGVKVNILLLNGRVNPHRDRHQTEGMCAVSGLCAMPSILLT